MSPCSKITRNPVSVMAKNFCSTKPSKSTNANIKPNHGVFLLRYRRQNQAIFDLSFSEKSFEAIWFLPIPCASVPEDMESMALFCNIDAADQTMRRLYVKHDKKQSPFHMALAACNMAKLKTAPHPSLDGRKTSSVRPPTVRYPAWNYMPKPPECDPARLALE